MMRCTHRNATGDHCRKQAIRVLSWTSQIGEGWRIICERSFCEEHAQECADRMTRKGYVVQNRVGTHAN